MKKNTNNILKSLLVMLGVVTGMQSCQKLQEEPVGLSTPTNFYATPAQCEAALTGAMFQLYHTWGGYQGLPGYASGEFGGASLDIGATAFNDIWTLHYNVIANLNAMLKAVKGGSLGTTPAATVAELAGEAKFLRAFNYFTLVRLYGKIPYITEETPDPISKPLTPADRLEIAAVYDKIEADLAEGIASMNDYDGSAPARPCTWTAKSLLAKVYITRATAPLNQKEYYVKARDLADDIITNGPYKLLTNLADIFKTSNRNNAEMIFSYQSTDGNQYMPGFAWAPSEMGGWSGGQVKIDAVDRPDYAYYYPEQPRKHWYNLLDFTSDIYNPSAPIINWKLGVDGSPYVGKYNMPYLTLEEQAGGGDAHINMPVIRYPDILLIYAEAANMAGNGPTQLAVDRINMIINRANAPVGTDAYGKPFTAGTEPLANVSMSQAEFDAKVINERYYELCYENDRYFDVLRKRILKEVNLPDNAQGYDENDYLLPIPPMDAKNLGQNPGY